MTEETRPTAVQMKEITKRFPGVVANDAISLEVRKGEIHALLGENGAGKSTLMNILFGLYQPDEGEVWIHGRPVKISDPGHAIALGIGMIHQHFMLVEPFTVTQNIVLGLEPRRWWEVNFGEAAKQVGELSQTYGLKVDPHARIRDISVGMQQRVEILKTLYRGADILIFDEPTAVLTPQEIDELLKMMRRLAEEGKTILLITHKLREIMAVADRVTVIRRGKVVGTLQTAQTTPDELAAKMVGRQVRFDVVKQPVHAETPVLEVRNVSATDERGVQILNQLSFEIRAGEVLGIAGVEGNGQREMIEVITGLLRAASGEIRLGGRPIRDLSPRAIAEAGVGYIPEDRQKRGLILDFSVANNLVLKQYFHEDFQSRGFLKHAAIRKHAQQLIEAYDVRTPSAETPVRALSGGNQQKTVIARELHSGPPLLIATQPTRGLDVGAIEFIHRRILEQRDQGKAVLLYSLELEEIMRLSDRIAVIYEGRIIGVVRPEEIDEREIGLMMSGHSRAEAERESGQIEAGKDGEPGGQ